MKHEKHHRSIGHDAARAAAVVIIEEFAAECPHCMWQSVNERLVDIIEAAVEAAFASKEQSWCEPSEN